MLLYFVHSITNMGCETVK